MANFNIAARGIASLNAAFEQLSMRFEGDTVFVVGPTVEYAIFVELGTSQMEARPFVRPAAERVRANPSRVSRFLDGDILEAGDEALVEATALAVEAEMDRIIEQKGLIDTGTMRASVTVEQIQ